MKMRSYTNNLRKILSRFEDIKKKVFSKAPHKVIADVLILVTGLVCILQTKDSFHMKSTKNEKWCHHWSSNDKENYWSKFQLDITSAT